MIKETSLRRMVSIAAALAVGVALMWAFVFVPRLGAHPQAIAERVNNSSKVFFAIQLVAVIVLLIVVILSRRGAKMLGGPLYLGAVLLFLHDFMVFDGAVEMIQTYEGFRTVAILMFVCIGLNLVAAVLAIRAGNGYQKLAKARQESQK